MTFADGDTRNGEARAGSRLGDDSAPGIGAAPRPATDGSVHPAIAAALGGLDDAAVSWAVLRGDLSGSDDEVDVLVEPSEPTRLRSGLTAAGFHGVPAIGHHGHRFFRAYDEPSDRWFTLDLVTELAYGVGGSLLLPVTSESVLARRVPDDGSSRLAPDDEFWTLLLHDLLDRGSMPDQHADRLARLVGCARVDGPIGEAIDGLAGRGMAERLIGLVQDEDRAAALSAGRSLGRRWARADPLRTLGRRAGHTIGRHLRKPFTALRRPGIAVAILGPDGAGKSSLARALKTDFPVPTRTIYLGLYGGGLTTGGSLGLLRRLGRLWRGWLLGRWHRSRGRLVVYDRYSLDARVPGRRGGTRSRIRRWILAHAIPPPELVIVLDAPASVLFARKGEHDLPALEEQRLGYREIGRRLAGAQMVDAARGEDLVRRDVTARTWRRLAEGYRGG